MRAAPETNPILRARARPGSRSAAITAMCAQCMGCTEEKLEPGFRKDIRECVSKKCPLWVFRPYQSGEE